MSRYISPEDVCELTSFMENFPGVVHVAYEETAGAAPRPAYQPTRWHVMCEPGNGAHGVVHVTARTLHGVMDGLSLRFPECFPPISAYLISRRPGRPGACPKSGGECRETKAGGEILTWEEPRG